ncbi:alpha/beta hydrolase domain-containing protein [Parahaliea mediterranea]|uniref:alpha/beta hydrolase domain-containing protein n=1 Tax=Parahaliea mediterranea TaxID=651086 RepID=UPI0018806775|nr:alpha/beta hydrolase domain-containing protein [Parahaliea mediterranea]
MQRQTARPALALALMAALVACSDSSDRARDTAPPEPQYLSIPQPAVAAPPDAGAIALLSTSFDLAEVGYEQQEYFISGSASAFTNLGELGSDGRWEVEPGEQAQYRTRIVVYRPQNAADFSGTVLLEWLNVTAGFDTPPSYGSGHVEMLRAGHVWAGVSAQIVGIEGAENPLVPLHLKAAQPERYASLEHPGDSFAYDIFAQAGQALRRPAELDLLNGLVPQRIIALGESQSAGRLVTFINAVHPLYNAFDGYLVHSRGDGSPALAQAPQVDIPTPPVVTIRDDLNVPVLNFQTETDVIALGAVTDRQDDSDRFRLWEVAGSAHGDYYSFVAGRADTGQDPYFAVVVEQSAILGFIQCERPMNAGPMPWVFNAALRALEAWVKDGTAPPAAPRLAVNDAGDALLRDSDGIATGGIRTPYVDAPPGILTGEPNGGDPFCFLFGTTELFSADHMAARYTDQAGYENAVAESADAAVAAGFLLPQDAERIKAAAALQWQFLYDSCPLCAAP